MDKSKTETAEFAGLLFSSLNLVSYYSTQIPSV